jgi:hypothetical protein
VAEWLKAPVLKTGNVRKGVRGFESHLLRQEAAWLIELMSSGRFILTGSLSESLDDAYGIGCVF